MLKIRIPFFSFLFFGGLAFASDNVEFDSSFLRIDKVDVSKFSMAGYIQPGVYLTSVYLNDRFVANKSIIIADNQEVCFVDSIVNELNFDYDALPMEFISSLKSDEKCLNLEEYLVGASMEFDLASSRIDIQIPQIYMSRLPRGYTNPALWDEGISAGFVSYNIHGYNSSYDDKQTINAYFNAGLNVGAWYLRHKGAAYWSSEGHLNYNNVNFYLEKPISDIKGKAVIGFANTDGQLFDSLSILGAQIKSDNKMLPESQRGYAPQIFGIARSNARVTVSQNGNVIYEMSVSPGEFLIDDLYPSGFGGYLDVVVYEADGSKQKFSVPYDSMSRLLRTDAHEYSFTLGQYADDSLISKPLLAEGVYERGLNNSVTVYGGVRGNQNYLAGKGGIAFGTPFGALSFDITQANTELLGPYKDRSGQSFEAQYSKSITSTGSSVTLGAYRYSTKGFMDYQTAMKARDLIQRGQSIDNLFNSKNRIVFNVGQNLYDNWGQLHLSGSFENNWNDEDYISQYQLAYSNQFKFMAWGVNVSRSENESGDYHTSYSLNFSMPLGIFDETSPPQLYANSYHDRNGSRQQIGITDVAGEYSEINYGLNMSREDRTGDISMDVNAGYVSSVASLSVNASKGKNFNNQRVGVSGTIVGHSGGITLSPLTGDNIAIIEAKKAKNAMISGYGNVQVDSNGYAVVPNLRAYSENNIQIDLTTAPAGIELESSSKKVVPYDNAIVLMKFDTKFGYPILVNSSFAKGSLPFGAAVSDIDGNVVGSVGQNSRIFARVPASTGMLKASWDGNECVIDYQLSDTQIESNNLIIFDEVCR